LALSDAVIRVVADISKAERGIDQLVSKLNRIQQTVIDVKMAPATVQAERVVGKLTNRLATLGREARTAVGQVTRLTEGVGVLAVSGKTIGGVSTALGSVAAKAAAAAAALDGASGSIRSGFGLGGLKQLLHATAGQFQSFGGQIDALSAKMHGFSAPVQALMDTLTAFGPSATAAAGAIALLGATMHDVLGREVKSIGENATEALKGMTDQVQALLQALSLVNREGGTLNQFSDLRKRGVARLNDNNSNTVEAARAANTIARAEEKITAEKKAQLDLIRAAKGLQPQDVRNAEVARRQAFLTSGRNAQKAAKEAADEAQRLADELWEANKAWNSFQAEGRAAFAEEIKKATDAIRQFEQVQSDAARKRLTGSASPLAFDAGGVKRRAISGVAYPNGAGPAASPTAVEGSVVNQVKRAAAAREQISAAEMAAAKRLADYEMDVIQQELVAEVDKIEAVTKARLAADRLEQKQWDARLKDRIAKQKAADKQAADARKALETRRATASKQLEGLAIGGAFPLLFGGGAGSVVGGALGGLNTANPIFSVFTSAIGQMLDQFAAAAQETGAALRDPITNFEQIKEKGLLAGKAQEYYVSKLIEVGRITEAVAVIQSELVKKVGVSGVNDLNRLGATSDKLSKAWAELNLQMQAAIAGPLAQLLEWITSVVRIFGEAGRSGSEIKDILGGLTPGQQQALQREMLRNNQLYGTSPKAIEEERKILDRYKGIAKPQQLAPTAIDPKAQETARNASRQQADDIKSAYREAFQLQRRAADIQREITDYRRKVESDIFAKQQEAKRLEIDNARKAAQINIEQTDLALRKQFAGSQGLTGELLNGVRAYISARRSGEADIEQKRRQLEVTLADINKATSDYVYEQANRQVQLERSIEDYKMAVADYQLKVARQIQDLQIVPPGGGGAAGPGAMAGSTKIGQPVEYLTGDRSSSGYRADHGGNNYHEHIAYRTAQEARAAAELLNKAGIKTTELKGVNPVGRHASGSYHYSGQAFDVPAAQVPVGQEQALSRRVRQILGIGGTGAQLSAAAGGISRPTFQAPSASTAGFSAAQGRLAEANKKSVELEKEHNRLKLEAAAFDVQELARGQSQVDQAKRQLDLEKSKLTVVTSVGTLNENQLAILLQQKEGEAKIAEIVNAQKNALLEINTALKESKITQAEADVLIKQINTGVEQRLENTRTQIALEQELLKVQQAQQLALEAQNMQRKLATTGQGIRAGYTGGAAGQYDSVLGRTGDAGLAGQFAGAQSVLDQLAQAESDASSIGSSIAGGFREALKAAVTGGDIKGAFASMLGSLGDKFLEMAFRPIEQALTQAVFGMLAPSNSQVQAAQMMLLAAQQQLQAATMMSAGGAASSGTNFFSSIAGIAGAVFGVAGAGFGGGAFGSGFNPLSTTKLFPGGIFASGGSTPVNTPVLVGERGPELFVPGQSGGITNHQNLRSMMASGGSQQNGGSGSVTNLSFETVRIMDQEWVDRPQLEAAMAAASKRGAAEGERRALDKLKQSPSTRRGLGL
jgi:hypothetical protein